jgi:putative addiction module killer protein
MGHCAHTAPAFRPRIAVDQEWVDVCHFVSYRLHLMKIQQTPEFRQWLERLRDRQARARIAARLLRLETGNLGDVAPIGSGLSELRIHYGPGYRLYLAIRGKTAILLLCGGDKSSQTEDITKAKILADRFSSDQNSEEANR